MDPITIAAIVFAIVAVLTSAMMEGTSLAALVNPSAFLIIAGGTVGATFASFSMHEIKTLMGGLKLALKKEPFTLPEIFDLFGELATLARREGLLVLENYKLPVENTLLKRGVSLIVDGTEPTLLKDMLITELTASEQQAKAISGVFQTAGGFAPTMGIIGTVMGLVNVLGNLEDPNELGPAISVAFLATLYGIGFANIICLPISKKIAYVAKRDTELGLIIVEALVSIQSGDNPRVVQEKLKSYIDESMWSSLRTKAPEKK